MKKQVLSVVAATSMVLVLAGCGGQQAAPAAPATTDANASHQDHAATQDDGKVVKEIPMGDSVEKEGMDIGGVYFEASELFPHEKAGMKMEDADIHIEADIKATKDNKTGFGAGEWMPYLTVNYVMKNLDSGKEFSGTLMPMNAQDGPHYGANVKMPGAGKYKFHISIESPEKQNYLLHVDKGTGVEGKFWTQPVEVEWEFPYVPKK